MKLTLAGILRVLGALLTLYVVVSLLAWKFQERLAFPAPRAQLPDPAAFGIRGGERIAVTASDGILLHGWYLPPDPAPPPGRLAPGLLWFYGNMETIRDMGAVIREFRPPGTALLVLDYRGYGESEGTPTEAGIYRDAEAAWGALAARAGVDSTRIAVYGRSVGSVPALYLADRRPVKAVILDSPFTRALDMAALHYPWLPRFLVNLSLDNLRRARAINVPLLIFHGSDDRVSPLAMGLKIVEAGRGDLVILRGAGHNETYDVGGTKYRDRMWAFLADPNK